MLNKTGKKAFEKEVGQQIKLRFQGWYDDEICIDDGEKILSEIDNKAIKILRKNYLVWSGWPTALHSFSDGIIEFDKSRGGGYRILTGLDWKALKLFFLSILWRAAVSGRDDMKFVILSADMIEKLRIALINKDPLPFNEFPIRLYQIVTRGAMHNRTPIIEDIEFSVPPFQIHQYKICRVYLDGMIAHITLDPDEYLINNLKNTFLGARNETFIFSNKFEESRTYENLITVIAN